MDERLLTRLEVADVLRVSPVTVWRLQRAGRLRGVRLGRLLRFRQSEIEALLAGE